MVRLPGELPLDLGRVVATPGAPAALEEAEATPLPFLIRHASGDWGDVPEEDAELNNEAVRDFLRVLSSYTLHTGQRICVITEADRSSTKILLPGEY
ncbi:MAG: hypothetical protein AAGG48_01500 [Planctomycetota bacterium]